MIQALISKEFGNLGTTFGIGKDGGREYTYEGETKQDFLNTNKILKGYTVVQAKFKTPNTNERDNLGWVEKQFKGEMDKFLDLKKKLRLPDNYIFITNVRLTGQAIVGEIDKLNEFVKVYKNRIPNIYFILYDDLCGMLENNRDVAISYSSFILPGDVLNELYEYLKKDKNKLKDIIERYLLRMFKYDLYSKLEQSGRKTDDDIKIEEVFMDLKTTKSNFIDSAVYNFNTSDLINPFLLDTENEFFIERIIKLSNDSQRCFLKNENKLINENKFVLIGTAGQGKSTLTQFLCQLYRAFFINAQTQNTPAPVKEFLKKLGERKFKVTTPNIFRFPIRVILPDYNDWIIKQKKSESPTSVINYIKSEIENDGDKLELSDIRDLLTNLSLIIIFDGLDEVPASGNRDLIVKEIDIFIDFELHKVLSDAIIIITTRPQGFKDEFNSEKFTHLKIVELSQESCLNYIEILLERTTPNKVKLDKQLGILKKAIYNDSSSRLMRTPLDATIMSTLVKRGGNPPEVKYNLYKEYYNTIFDREREKQVFEMDKFKLAINSLHEYLGFKLQCNSEQKNKVAKITRKDFREIINDYFLKKDFNEDDALENTNLICDVLTTRLVMISELSVDLDNQENNVVGFPVAPIQEYFASLFLINGQEDIIIKRLETISSNSYWRNVLLFVIGYFQNERRQHLIDNIYSMCKQNNLSNETISKVGSWLAVDVLIENIFSEAPRYEKLFAMELEQIISLSYNEKLIIYYEFQKLF